MARFLNISAAALVLLCTCANSITPSPSPPCIERERRALVEFKASLHDPSNLLSSWEGDHCCQWEGIGCDNLTGHVLMLHLSTPFWKCMRSHPYTYSGYYWELDECWELYDIRVEGGDVNPSLLHLQYLTHLDLSGNHFNDSPIPTFIGSMHRLTYLSLSGASFGGRIPNSLGNLTNLQFLDLGRNSGLETSNGINWISRLGSLQHLDMSQVSFGNYTRKLLDHLVNLSSACKLQVLSLAETGLSVSDLDALQNMTTSSLVHLDLSSNYLTSVPSWFLELKTLVHLDISGNRLKTMECSVSSILRNLCHLKLLDLSDNNLQQESIGLINESSSCVPYNLESLDLSYNQIRDSLPSWLEQLKNLKNLFLEQNFFYGPIPFSFQKLSKLEFLYLSSNNLEGNLPNNIGKLLNLTRLDLSNNYFSSTIPQSLGQLINLVFLDFSYNHFNGSISKNFDQLINLGFLDLSNNHFNGSIPKDFGQLINLYDLDLSNNHFNGNIPQNIGHLINLEELSLSNNSFSGYIPQSFGLLKNLLYLNLSTNKLCGSIPTNFGHIVNLAQLDLSSNNLDGAFTIGKDGYSFMSDLYYLSISNNQISGSLPKHIGHMMPNLDLLLLGNNLINGTIPSSLCQTQLSKLDLSMNRLVGEIPNCWKDTHYWEEINLSSNKLSGTFPSSFGNLSSLFWLHLNNNSLQGELPMMVGNLKQLLILDFGENQFSGSIPTTWTANTFPSLHILRLRQNRLGGNIPLQLCQLSSLKILDISHNKLQGSIPRCIGNLRGMTLNNSSKKSFPHFGRRLMSLPARKEPKWSTEHVKEVMKGRELDYIKILELVVIMDLSENNLVGSIPEGLTFLNRLHGLNLSNNHLRGKIPEMIGDMKSLESFDVSNNQLSGTIPSTMQALTSLSHLNLSHNNFSGPIPTGNQFSTYDSSIYADNPYLCGPPLPKKCYGDDSNQVPMTRGFEEDEGGKESKLEKWLFYFVVAAGFATGFWGVFGVLFLKKSWRHAYFRWVEDLADKIYVAIAVKVAKLKKRD